MVEASCFQASRLGAEGTTAGLAASPSREAAVAVVTEGAGGDVGAVDGLGSAVEAWREASVLPFTAPPSVRKWKLREAEETSQGGPREPFPGGRLYPVSPFCPRPLK